MAIVNTESLDSISNSDIAKIGSKLLELSYDTEIKMNVVLIKYTKDSGRIEYYRETAYPRVDKKFATNIMLDYDYYLTIEGVRRWDINLHKYIKKNIYVQIRMQDMMLVRETVNSVYKMIRMNYDDIYSKDEYGHPVIKNPSLVLGSIENLLMGNFIIMKPDVREQINDNKVESIRFIFKDEEYTLVDLPKFYGLVELVNCINLPMYAQELVNYCERPELGRNRYVIQSDNYDTQETEGGNKNELRGNSTRRIGYFNPNNNKKNPA